MARRLDNNLLRNRRATGTGSYIHVRKDSELELRIIRDAVAEAKRILVVTGAWVSTAAGLPDYRSKNGLYPINEVFHTAAMGHAQKRLRALELAADINGKATNGKPTEAHKFIRSSADDGKLIRCYTSNVDGLERAAGLSLSVDPPADCIPLHGSASTLRCIVCHETHLWNGKLEVEVSNKQEPLCTRWSSLPKRAGTRRQKSSIGRLRPNIICLGEEHEGGEGECIARLINIDQCKNPDLLLILGKSLAVRGPRDLVARFSHVVKAQRGKVIFINLSKPKLGKLRDYWVEWECNSWVEDLKSRSQLESALLGSSENPIVLD